MEAFDGLRGGDWALDFRERLGLVDVREVSEATDWVLVALSGSSMIYIGVSRSRNSAYVSYAARIFELRDMVPDGFGTPAMISS